MKSPKKEKIKEDEKMGDFPKNHSFEKGKCVDSEMDVGSEAFKDNKNHVNLETLPEAQCEVSQADREDQVDL